MVILNKVILSVIALLAGPVIVVLTDPFLKWSAAGGLFTMALVSATSVYAVWRRTPAEKDDEYKVWSYVQKYWMGEEKLWKVFWIIGIVFTVLFLGSSYAGSTYNAPIIWWILLALVAVVIQVWWLVSVWRCAKNTSKKIFEILAKTFVVIAAANTIYNVIKVFAIPS